MSTGSGHDREPHPVGPQGQAATCEPRPGERDECAGDFRAGPRDADFSRAVLEDLYRYPLKREGIAYLLWALLGLVGGHRFYLGRPATALVMLCTLGGALIWWLVDLFLIGSLVTKYNRDQLQRKERGLPPRALSFMPPLHNAQLPPFPEWVAERGGGRRLLGDLCVLAGAGFAAGVLAPATGNYEPIVVIVALCAITLLGARWDALASIPLLKGFDRWSHRLRLFYYVHDPGGPLRLFFRPLYGLVSAPFRQRARAEAWLYLQLGAWFTVLFTGLDLLQTVSFSGGRVRIDPSQFFVDLALTFVSIYAFAAPVGAILTTHVLLQKRDAVVWMLSGITLVATLLGIESAG